MNPYDFVPLDRTHPPELRKPVWHNALSPMDTYPAKLYSGHLFLYIRAETPLYIRDARSSVQDPDYPGEHIQVVTLDRGGTILVRRTNYDIDYTHFNLSQSSM